MGQLSKPQETLPDEESNHLGQAFDQDATQIFGSNRTGLRFDLQGVLDDQQGQNGEQRRSYCRKRGRIREEKKCSAT